MYLSQFPRSDEHHKCFRFEETDYSFLYLLFTSDYTLYNLVCDE